MTYRVIPFASPQSELWHPFTGEHLINSDDRTDQLMYTYYPRGSHEHAGPHMLMTRLAEYGANRWETVTVTPLPANASPEAIRALFAALRGLWQDGRRIQGLDGVWRDIAS